MHSSGIEDANSLKHPAIDTLIEFEKVLEDNQKLKGGDIVFRNSLDTNCSGQNNLYLRPSLNNISLSSTIKTTFLQFYIARLRKAISDEDISIQRIPLDRLSRLFDSIIFGSSSERITGISPFFTFIFVLNLIYVEHFKLFGSTMNQQQLQAFLNYYLSL